MKVKNSWAKMLMMIMATALLLSGCSGSKSSASGSNDQTNSTVQTTKATESTTAALSEETTKSTKADTISLYMPDKALGVRKLTPSFTGPWTAGKDIASFEAFLSKEASISGSTFKTVWENYWKKDYPDTTNYKIGYYISFTLNSSKVISKVVKGYEDTNDFRDYLELYVYDDVHQIQGNWYSHLTTADTTKESILTSIKLTAGSKINDIKTISLTVFTYSSDKDFSSTDGTYIGNNSYTISVNRGN